MKRGLLAAFVVLWPAIVAAQQQQQQQQSAGVATGAEARPVEPPLSLAGTIDAATYVIGPGDRLLVELWGLQEESREVDVNAEGRLLVPRIGMFAASGRTLESVREEVVRLVKEVYPRLSTNLTLTRPRTFAVYVVGAVARPGSYRATPLTKVSELIPSSNPLPNASTRRLEIRRKARTAPIKADLIRFSVLGDASADPTLLDGDTIYVPLREFEVEATGAVRRPGRYELVGARTGGELLELAGGASSDVAFELPLRITTRTEGDRLEARSIANLADAADAPLRPGDVVHVPALADLQRTVTVEGAVRIGTAVAETAPAIPPTAQAPDAALPIRSVSTQIAYVNGETVRDIIVRVGGLQPWADGKLSYLLRAGSDGVRRRIAVDVIAVTTGQTPDTPVQPGDTLVVPSRREAVVVGGAVYHPGLYAYSRGLKPMDYITLAGGATRNGRPQSARVLQRTGQSAEITDVQEIEPGDVISVPEASISTAEWLNLSIIFANLAVGTTALVYTVTHR
jgi:protein involved in polysaccharide export with SLBB domain